MSLQAMRLGVCLVSFVCGGAWAQEAAPGGPLSGPKVGEVKKKSSLVERDFDGKVRRLEVTPEEAALRMMELDAPARAKVDREVAARAKLFDDFVRQNLDLLAKFASAQGNKVDQGMLLRETFEKAAPIRAHGRLQEHVLEVLPEEKKQEFTNLVEEYRRALVVEDSKLTNEEGKPHGRGGAVIKIGFEQFGQEIRRAYERVVGEGQGKLEGFLKKLELTDEQDGKVRKLLMDFFGRYMGKEAPGAAKLELVMKIATELDQGQKAKLWEFIRKGE